jgi:hypothetical protein
MAIIKPPIPLEDIIMSPAQGFWPLAPGWWILIVLSLALIGWLLYRLIKKRRYQNFYRKQLKIIDSLEKHLRKDQLDSQEMYKILNRILKLYLIHYSKDKKVIPLTGKYFKDWVAHKVEINWLLNPIFDDSIYQQNKDIEVENSSLNAMVQFKLLLQQLDKHFKQQRDVAV